MEDKLNHIFELQKQLNKRIGVDTDNMNEEDQIKWVLNYCRALSQETAELIDSVPWKWWAKYQKFDKQNARVEVVDMFHFLVSLGQVLGLTADDIYNGYLEKNKVNFARQDNGYATKDEGDNKHIFVNTEKK
jgi:dimeric dUTPase (all-alpha-NTP-PPase superfamily)